MAKFVQIIEFKTSHVDEVLALGEEFRAERAASADDEMPVVRGTFTTDRDRPGYCFNIIEFESYEAAMKNSALPETTKFAERMMELCDGPPKFYNLDVAESWTPTG